MGKKRVIQKTKEELIKEEEVLEAAMKKEGKVKSSKIIPFSPPAIKHCGVIWTFLPIFIFPEITQKSSILELSPISI